MFICLLKLPMTDDGTGLEMTATSHDSSSSEDDDVEVESDDEQDLEKNVKKPKNNDHVDLDDANEGV